MRNCKHVESSGHYAHSWDEQDEIVQVEDSIRSGEMGLSLQEMQFMDEAVEIARRLDRPFTEREVLAHARQEGYDLKLAFDARFVKVSGRQGATPPLWRLDEDTARLHAMYLSDFFIALAAYAQRCVSQAWLDARPIIEEQHRYILDNSQKKLPREIVAELLRAQGWTWEEQ